MSFFDYFQIATVALVLAVIFTKATYLRITTGINPIVIGRGKGAWRIVEILSLGSLILWMTEVVLRALHSRYDLFPEQLNLALLAAGATKLLGAALAGIGLATFVLAFLSFGNSWRIGIDRKTPGILITGGIFGVTRNPIYVGFHFYFFGIFLLNATWFFLIFALLAALAVHFQILREEAFLRDKYGEEFAAYCRRTARYIIW